MLFIFKVLNNFFQFSILTNINYDNTNLDYFEVLFVSAKNYFCVREMVNYHICFRLDIK